MEPIDPPDPITDPLRSLRWHWSSAYAIHCFGVGRWVAQRRDGRGTLRADNPVLLHEMIVADYTATPVPRP